MIEALCLSLLRWAIGLAMGTVVGFALAMGTRLEGAVWSSWARLFDFLRAIPIIGLVPVIQMNIGVSEYGKIGLIAWAVMFPVWISVRRAARQEYRDLALVIYAAQLPRRRARWNFLWARLIGGLIHGVEIGIGIAWLSLVAAEWVGTYREGFWSGGLGYELLLSYEQNDWLRLHGILLLFGVLGLCTTAAWRRGLRFALARTHGFDPQRGTLDAGK